MSDCDIPSEAEQNEAWEYVCKRELERPDINVIGVIKYTVLFICAVTICTFSTSLLLRNNHVYLILLGYSILGLTLFSKRIIIGVIKLYQHYAPERIRRKCIFKPTCSEYMILALEKYGLVKGLYKGIYRMFFKCSGFYYSIDYP
jgi:putative component of membrane protein insertase Oxa1/YidC/SpoIIIJ protein YidD